ncbi:DUF1499 domain-containing protein [Tabrizicola sp.]|uniref:DUF1499 domain-containing protein n=1 Tax=Tabrizicola sp. TaxID=2005166 RepID=UPI002630297E|nr:DUF1499 domain-containing protein [Tabrizicola sp.]MDM7930886.1 DUF1499 domain-containing protein [Tabrizicola sp.]
MAGYALIGLFLALVAFGAYVRLAPSDPTIWHIDPASALPTAEDRVLSRLGEPPRIVTTLNSAAAAVEVQGAAPAALARLDEIALATPRTTRLAGSPEEGHITWVTRSALWGFPDYTTAQALTHDVATSEVTIFARSRFGKGDMGVNGARLRDWLSRL